MQCWIYKGSRREETYLYLATKDGTEQVPAELLAAMGELELVMQLQLSAQRPLARANTEQVMHELAHKGYYLQMPPVDMPGQGRIQ